jgi:hypothetical protein
MSSEGYRGTDSLLPDLFHESLQSNTPLANLFLTGFDQQNPLPFGSLGGDTFMGGVPEQEEGSVQSDAAGGGGGGGPDGRF